jgi:hypothetical protein
LAAGVRFDPGAAPRAASGSQPGPPGIVFFDSIAQNARSFSPNSDGILDVAAFSYRLTESGRVTIRVQRTGTTVADTVVVDEAEVTGRSYTKFWYGHSTSGARSAEGLYEVVFKDSTLAGRIYLNTRQVRLDVTTPQAQILEVAPPVYTPTVAPSKVRVRVAVTRSVLDDDSLQVHLTPSDTLRFRIVDGFHGGEGEYVAECVNCGGAQLHDGVYAVKARVHDRAGNSMEATSSLDKDVIGPKFRMTHPGIGTSFFVPRADWLTGLVHDRHGVSSVRMRVDPDTAYVALTLESFGPPDTMSTFRADLATRLAAEGRYTLRLRAWDRHGVEDNTLLKVKVDRTPPGQPRFSPIPGPVTKTSPLRMVLRIDTADTYEVLSRIGDAPVDSTRNPSSETIFFLALRPGPNRISFAAVDTAGNVSAAESTTVAWEPSRGLVAPERFRAGNVIQVQGGPEGASGAEVRIYAVDGSLVRKFTSGESAITYTFTWDLNTPDGRRVKNGAYLVQARLLGAGGVRMQQMIAILE